MDKKCNFSKTIIEDESYQLDKYISSNFDSSEQLRKKFDQIIKKFLQNNSNIIKKIEDKTNKRYSGQIVILSVLDDGNLKRVKVLYKKDLIFIKKTLIKNQEVMREFIKSYKKYFSSYIINKTKRILSDYDYQYMINEWYHRILDNSNYFEICRDLLNFKKNYFTSKKNAKNDMLLTTKQYEDNEIDDKYDPDIEYYPDLDDIYRQKDLSDNFEYDYYDNDFDCEYNKQKIKTKKLNQIPGQISFFD